MEITIHTGGAGDYNTIHVSWFSYNGVTQITELEINVKDQDKPRELELKLNGAIIATIPSKEF